MSEKHIRIYSDNHKFTINRIEYTWRGGCGCVFTSKENNVKIGDVRVIGNIIFHALSIDKKFRYKIISWCPVEHVDPEWIQELKREIFRC